MQNQKPDHSAWYRIRWEVLQRDDFTCRYCGQFAPSVLLTASHVVPQSEGGTDDPANLVAACYACIQGKKAYRAHMQRRPHPAVLSTRIVVGTKILALLPATMAQLREHLPSVRDDTLRQTVNRLRKRGAVRIGDNGEITRG